MEVIHVLPHSSRNTEKLQKNPSFRIQLDMAATEARKDLAIRGSILQPHHKLGNKGLSRKCESLASQFSVLIGTSFTTLNRNVWLVCLSWWYLNN